MEQACSSISNKQPRRKSTKGRLATLGKEKKVCRRIPSSRETSTTHDQGQGKTPKWLCSRENPTHEVSKAIMLSEFEKLVRENPPNAKDEKAEKTNKKVETKSLKPAPQEESTKPCGREPKRARKNT